MDDTFSGIIFSNDDSKTTFNGATFNVNSTIMFEENYTGRIDDQGEVYSRNSKYRIEEEDIKNGNKNGEDFLNNIVKKTLIDKIGSGKINLPNKLTHIFIRIILGEFSDKSQKKISRRIPKNKT